LAASAASAALDTSRGMRKAEAWSARTLAASAEERCMIWRGQKDGKKTKWMKRSAIESAMKLRRSRQKTGGCIGCL